MKLVRSLLTAYFFGYINMKTDLERLMIQQKPDGLR